jgi:hypothetical protein
MPQRDVRSRIDRAKTISGAAKKEQEAESGIATWNEDPYWVLPHELTGGLNGSVLDDPRGPDAPDVSLAEYAAEYKRRNAESFAAMGFTAAGIEGLCAASYKMHLRWKRYVEPPQAALTPKAKAGPILASEGPEQVALDTDDLRDLDDV